MGLSHEVGEARLQAERCRVKKVLEAADDLPDACNSPNCRRRKNQAVPRANRGC